jgi:putative ABC transport system permease protein
MSFRDLRLSLRSLRRDPGFTLITILLLGLGIGATTSIFSVVDAVVLRPLPLQQPEELMQLGRGRVGEPPGRGGFSWPTFFELRAQARSWRGLVAFHEDPYVISRPGDPEVVQGVSATANLFDVLGVPPAMGRGFAPGEDEAGANQVVVISDGLWKRRFGADPAVLGRTIVLDGEAHTVIGVAPGGFHFPASDLDAELWTPVPHGQLDAGYRRPELGMGFLQVWGRLAPGISQSQAQAELETIRSRLAEKHPGSYGGRIFSLVDVGSQFIGDARTALFTLLLAVGFVLLIACANVGNLLLARATVRQREMAVRAALGASRGQLVLQLLTESALLALAGAFVGLVLASNSLQAVGALLPASLLRINEIAINARVLAFTVLATTATVLVFGVAPALAASRAEVHATLRAAGRGIAGRGHRTRTAMLVGQISLAFVLLVGAGLALRSLARVTGVDPGFDARNLLVASVSLSSTRYQTPEQVRAFHRSLLPRLQSLPGAEKAALAMPVPFARTGVSSTIDLLDGAGRGSDKKPSIAVRFVSPDYLSLMGIRLLRGRSFVAADEADGAPPVAVVSESLARQLWPHDLPIGKRLGVGMAGDEQPAREVVGVVGDIRTRLDGPGRAEIYLPFVDMPFTSLTVVLRSPQPLALVGSLRGEVLAVDPAQPIAEVRTMEQRLHESVQDRRLSALLLALFAGLALLLASIGVYGVLSYTVAQRRREVGVRMAVGAQARQIWRLVVGQAVRWALLGLVIGLAAALAMSRVLASQLYGISPTDPLTFTALALLLLAVSAAASLIPARRATRVDPMIAMRDD